MKHYRIHHAKKGKGYVVITTTSTSSFWTYLWIRMTKRVTGVEIEKL